MSLLLLTGAAGMFVGAEGWPNGWEFPAMMFGLALACGGSSALNHVMDADIDRLMGERTAARPVASGRVAAPRALEFGVVLMALSFALLATTVNVLTALLALVGGLFYVIVYTGYLKRSTDQNIVIGGAAGAVPPLVGFAAATGNLTLPALWLFLIVFLWTPPHFWALALMIKEHYAAANVPMLPGTRVNARRRGRSCSTRSCWSPSPWPSAGGSGPSIPAPRCCSAPTSSCSRGNSAATRHVVAPSCCSTTRSRTSRCCSSLPRSIRCSSEPPSARQAADRTWHLRCALGRANSFAGRFRHGAALLWTLLDDDLQGDAFTTAVATAGNGARPPIETRAPAGSTMPFAAPSTACDELRIAATSSDGGCRRDGGA